MVGGQMIGGNIVGGQMLGRLTVEGQMLELQTRHMLDGHWTDSSRMVLGSIIALAKRNLDIYSVKQCTGYILYEVFQRNILKHRNNS